MVLKLGTFRAVDQRDLGSSEMWCWRRTGKIIWSDRVTNEEVKSQGGDESPTNNKKKEG
jgi:hypothetical protein